MSTTEEIKILKRYVNRKSVEQMREYIEVDRALDIAWILNEKPLPRKEMYVRMYEHKYGDMYLDKQTNVDDFMVGRCFIGAENGNSTVGWVINKGVMHCMSCMQVFVAMARKHHCRACGNLICHDCGAYFAFVRPISLRLRICKCCFDRSAEVVLYKSYATTWIGRGLLFTGIYKHKWQLMSERNVLAVTEVNMKFWKKFEVLTESEEERQAREEKEEQQTEDDQLNYLIECSRKYSGVSSVASGNNNSRNGSFANPHSEQGSGDDDVAKATTKKKSIFRKLILKFYIKIVNGSSSNLIVVTSDDPNAQNVSSVAVGAGVSAANVSVNFSEKKTKYQIQSCWKEDKLKVKLSSKFGYVTVLLKTIPTEASTIFQIIMLDKKVARGEKIIITEDMTKCWIGSLTHEEYNKKYL